MAVGYDWRRFLSTQGIRKEEQLRVQEDTIQRIRLVAAQAVSVHPLGR